ncbi:hypothetical protein ACIQXV_07615 [Neobacillus sp. NPDC097160]|uniref:hypothetical protein n=1 Tax=Neobacillus sp. NPDC097160 TaxID=3364298 RepID=UPI00380EC763
MQKDRNSVKAFVPNVRNLSQLVGATLSLNFQEDGLLDHYWGTEPIFLIIGLFVGLTAVFIP